MAEFNSEVSVFSVDDSGATLRDISAHITEITGLPSAGGVRDKTTLGDTVGHTYHRGLENVTFGVRGIFSDLATTGSNTVLSGLRTLTVTVSFEYGPKGSSTGFPRYTGEAFVTNFVEESRVGSLVSFSCDFQVNAGVTVGTFP